ncbi:MAG TPA: NHL repeat-containing protein [Blastocatellia bacterium]|nr:NHL repeat-containing protein [Blastocatellia bacterium]
MRRVLLAVFILALPSAIALYVYFNVRATKTPTSRDAVGQVTTFAGSGRPAVEDDAGERASFSEPFGIAVDARGNVIVSEGGQSNRVRIITPNGAAQTITGSEEGYRDGLGASALFNTPSAVAIDRRGNLIVADTSNNRVRRISTEGDVSTVAGGSEAGYRDGPAAEARFDSPVGVAVDREGNIFVADTYNDRVRKISAEGVVSTIAGAGMPGLADGQAESAMFDTPSGIAVDAQGNLFVADTGNDAVRKITPQGDVSTIAGATQNADAPYAADGELDLPVGIAITHDGFLFVASQGDGRVHRITPEGDITLFAGDHTGFSNGVRSAARFNGPSGVAVDNQGNVYVADTQNYLVRKIAPVAAGSAEVNQGRERESFIQPPDGSLDETGEAIAPDLGAMIASAARPFPWPLNPQNGWHEVTGVVGEARGAPGGIALHHLHSGLDIRGNVGDPVLSVIDEKVSRPIAAWGYGSSNEGIQIGLMSYIHIRVGRDAKGEVGQPARFGAKVDPAGKASRVRVRRGARFRVGDFIGTLNTLYHVHLNLGPWNAQANAIELAFPGLKDTIAPQIEANGIEVIGANSGPFKQKRGDRLVVSGDVDILVTAYDTIDGNNKSRKLGLYRVGYQLLDDEGRPVRGFEEPLINMEFNRMPPDDETVFLIYGPGSGVSAYGTPTKFKYIATNRVRNGRARDGVLRTRNLAPGNYTIRAFAQDYAGNRASGASAELKITIEN